jgi:para-aminobenzoate synthetase/4-amino-4-deoxychorismate lyase
MSCSPDEITLVIDFADRQGERRRLCFKSPIKIFVAESIDSVRPSLQQVQEAVNAGYYAAGYVAYEAAPAFDPALSVRADVRVPLLWFGIFKEPSHDCHDETGGGEFRLSNWSPTIDRQTYSRNFDAAREAIARGDTYQINYTFKLCASFAGDDFALYRQLAAKQLAPYCAYLRLGGFSILSASPELFFRWRDGKIETKPMKGTVRRGRWLEEDETLARWLADSEKNRAENLMIVDLLRNDLGRVSEIGSIQVRDCCAIEQYPTVFQMTSTVEARTRPQVTLEDIFAAMFPCGSVTGAPKVSTMRLISTLEVAARNVYSGSIGYVAPDGEAIFNVAIRTMLVDHATGVAEYGIGGGITWDSEADEEYAEALTKAAILKESRPDFQLLETLRLERGEYALLDRHLKRLADSARYFGFSKIADDAREALLKYAASFPVEARRVRLLASVGGKIQIESVALDELPATPARVAFALSPVQRQDKFLYHKTTHRMLYDFQRAQHPDCFDVLLWNEDGELTEFTNGNLVIEIEGERLTPARDSGLLAGTMRAELIERGAIREAVITRSSLGKSARMWLINSVRGWVPVSLAEFERNCETKA